MHIEESWPRSLREPASTLNRRCESHAVQLDVNHIGYRLRAPGENTNVWEGETDLSQPHGIEYSNSLLVSPEA
jgi:hypothetical protein